MMKRDESRHKRAGNSCYHKLFMINNPDSFLHYVSCVENEMEKQILNESLSGRYYNIL